MKGKCKEDDRVWMPNSPENCWNLTIIFEIIMLRQKKWP